MKCYKEPVKSVSVNNLIQPKKKYNGISTVINDNHQSAAEVEADTIAAKVVEGESIQGPITGRPMNIATKSNLQNIPGLGYTGISEAVDSKINQVKHSSGAPLPIQTQQFFEAKMGRDFSNVRIHNDSLAHESAVDINAKAYTVGKEIVFGKGEYSPASSEGKKLIAHELVHVAQDGDGIRKKDNDKVHQTGDVLGAAGEIIEVEAILREIYQKTDLAIAREAEYMISKGAPPGEVAKWVVETRNAAKAQIRKWDLDVLRLLAEKSNKRIYGDKLGPSYNDLRTGTRNGVKGAKPPKTDLEIIEGAKVTRPSVNKWLGRFRIAGRIMIVIDISISGYQVVIASPEERPKVFIREASRFAGALAGGWAGAKVGGAIGGAIGAWFAGAGAIPGAAIGGIIGGIGGAIGGGMLGQAGGELLINQLYPSRNTKFEGGFQ